METCGQFMRRRLMVFEGLPTHDIPYLSFEWKLFHEKRKCLMKLFYEDDESLKRLYAQKNI